MWCASAEINYLETAGTTGTTGTTEKFIIILMILCFAVVFFVSVVSVVSVVSKNLSQAPQPNFLSEGVRLGLDKEIAPDGTYLAYFPFGARIERSRMAPSREIISCQKGDSSLIRSTTQFLARRGQAWPR